MTVTCAECLWFILSLADYCRHSATSKQEGFNIDGFYHGSCDLLFSWPRGAGHYCLNVFHGTWAVRHVLHSIACDDHVIFETHAAEPAESLYFLSVERVTSLRSNPLTPCAYLTKNLLVASSAMAGSRTASMKYTPGSTVTTIPDSAYQHWGDRTENSSAIREQQRHS